MAHTAPMRKVHADLLAMIDAYALAVKTACIIASCGFATSSSLISKSHSKSNVMQVLANPTADIQEGPKVGRAELKARGVRPYDEKVTNIYLCLRKASVMQFCRLGLCD